MLEYATIVKLTRTLAIIPITLVLAFLYTRKGQKSQGKGVSLKSIFPFFILYFIAASLLTTVAVHFGVDASVFSPIKTLSKFFIVLAMAAIGNGIMLHGGLRAYVATFFVFSDYVKPMARLSALMGVPLTFVLTHDSIGVGEDGPTP